MSNSKIQEVFGQFAVSIDGKVQLFPTEAAAAQALSAFEGAAEHQAIAVEYTVARGLDGKNAKGKINVVVDFLAWVDAGRPGPVAVEAAVETAVEEAAAEPADNLNF